MAPKLVEKMRKLTKPEQQQELTTEIQATNSKDFYAKNLMSNYKP